MNITISDAVKYIGVDDTDIDLFESQYVVPEGVSYNSYLILDDKVALMDTVDLRKCEEWKYGLCKMLNGRKVDYLVISHMEPDHAGSIASVVTLFPDVTLVGNAKTFAFLNQFFEGMDAYKKLVVKEGDSLDLGAHKLTFYTAPMVHWPEVMVSYESSEKILFSADGFGKFGALSNEGDDWVSEARRYYFNIVGKYGAPVQALLKKAATLDIATICPLHGPVLKENLGYYIGLYDKWSRYEACESGVLIAYASIYGNTAKVARRLEDMLQANGVSKVVVKDLARDDMAGVISEAFYYDRMIVCAPSYDGGVFPCMLNFLHELGSKTYQNHTVGIVENGTWAPTAGKVMKEIISTFKNITIIEPTVTIRSSMKESDIPALEALVKAMK